jgi:succinate dehydrogenase/fumarate reductase flavoprotein subunit
MNKGAIELYADHGIDLYNEHLEIAVCAQHCNGGVAVDGNWQSDVDGLYVAGEAAGTFGVYRPGGSALNSTQVGSLRAAEHIAKKADAPCAVPSYTAPSVKYGKSGIAQIRNELQSQMSRVADFDRSTAGMRELFSFVDKLCGEFFDTVAAGDVSGTAELFALYDTVLTMRSVLSAMICSAKEVGTHGSALVDRQPDRSGGAVRTTRTVTKGAISHIEDVTPMPNPELWFETLLAKKKQEIDHASK